MKTEQEEKSLDAQEKNGVYLLAIHSERIGYTVRCRDDQEWFDTITINGNYVGTSAYFETECDDFEIDGQTLHLRYGGGA